LLSPSPHAAGQDIPSDGWVVGVRAQGKEPGDVLLTLSLPSAGAKAALAAVPIPLLAGTRPEFFCHRYHGVSCRRDLAKSMQFSDLEPGAGPNPGRKKSSAQGKVPG
jgi:hypothetical protein